MPLKIQLRSLLQTFVHLLSFLSYSFVISSICPSYRHSSPLSVLPLLYVKAVRVNVVTGVQQRETSVMLHVTLFRNLPRGSRYLCLSLSHTHTEAGFYVCDKKWKYCWIMCWDRLLDTESDKSPLWEQTSKQGKPRPDVRTNERACRSRGLHKTEAESTDFIETFVSQKSRRKSYKEFYLLG
jgi:hypothetical protein